MGHERWFRGQHDGQGRPFDWRAAARQRGIPEQLARALHERAVQQARSATQVEEIFLGLLAKARQDTSRPSPGKVTRTMRLEAERAGRQQRHAARSRVGRQSAAPGKVTLTSYLARPARDPSFRDHASDLQIVRVHLDTRDARQPRTTTPHVANELERTLDALLGTGTPTSQEAWAGAGTAGEAWTDVDAGEAWVGEESRTAAGNEEVWPHGEAMADRGVEHLPETTRARMERAFGQDFDEVVIYPESPEATGATRALTRGKEIHFRAGAYEPGTAAGDWLIAHELAHVVQQTARPGQSAGRRALEQEADRAAGAILAGQRPAVSLGASIGAALAFSDDEDHDFDQEETPAPASADAGGARGDAAVAGGAPGAAAMEPPAEPADATAGAASSELGAEAGDIAVDTAAGGEAEGAEGNEAALLAEIRTPVAADAGPAGGGGAGGGGAGGGEAVAEEAAVPEVSGQPPEQGLGALQGVRPDKLASALDGVRTAASSEVSRERSALAQDPPQQMSTGEAAAAAGAGAPGSALGVAAGEDAAAAGQPMQGNAAAAGEATQAVEGKVDNADTDVSSNEPPPPVAATRAPAVDDAPADENNARGGMSQTDAGRMSQAVAALPTRDPNAGTDPGPAPELAMTEDARAGAQRDRDALDTSLSDAESTAATHIAQPMGEDHIDVTLAPETLKAQLAAGDTAAEAGAAVADAGKALGTAKAEALGDAGESAAIIAQLERGAEIDAALATAQGQVAAERQAHAQRGNDERARADQEIATLKTQSEAEQEQARTDARTQVDQARTDWQAEVDSQTEAARTEADAEVEAGLSDVEAEQTRANSEAEGHIDKGREDAEAEQKKGEEEAERVKKDKEKESSGGFFGWLASKATAFFEGLKKAISSVLDAARKAIKRVIEVAKRLAVQVIEAARKAIVATIKAVGKALIAIGDRLLAAFPALRERFRATIQGLVDQAVEAVNALAESLKENVQKALDLLGKGLDAALGLLEKGLHAIVDGVNSVVQGAISFAKGVVEALGAFAVLIKDIAGDPGGWLGKLGGAVMDGIQNHLWSALKTAVLGWFESKVLEMLGIGGIVVQLLMEGGIDLGQITSMAWEALQTAIPAALIAILIEKLVSMIVPAAGAVMAIIEGLQAAWGTVSRIIAAFGAFVAFLEAVKGGGAGPLFANLLAAAAVVVLDFVASWLLRKLMSAARKVGAKLKNLAEKFKNRRKGKGKGKGRDRADGNTKSKARDDRNKPDKNKPKEDDKNKPKKDGKEKKKDQAAAERAAKQAANEGWRSAKASTGKQAMSKSAVEQTLRGAEGPRGGAKVQVDANVQGTSWSVKATATKDGQRATATKGRGSVLKSKSGGTFFASVDIRPVEKRVEAMTRKELTRANEQESKGRSSDLSGRLTHVEAKGQRMLDGKLQGLELSLKATGGKDKRRVHALIQPNYYEWEIEDGGGDFKEIKEEIAKHKEKTTRYNAALAILEGIGAQHDAHVSYDALEVDSDFATGIEVTFTKGEKKLSVFLHRLNTGPGKHEFQSDAQPGVCSLSGKKLATKPKTDGTMEPDDDKRTRPHDALAGSRWFTIIESEGTSLLGTQPGAVKLVNRLKNAAKDTKWFMVGDGRSSQNAEYMKVGESIINQNVESLHGNHPVGERQRQASNPANAVPGQPDDMYVQIHTGPSKAIIPKKHFQGTEWAGMSQDETNAALMGRIKIAIQGLRGIAQSMMRDPRVRSDVSDADLAKFFESVEKRAYQDGKW